MTLAALSAALNARLEGDPARTVDGVAEPGSAGAADIVILRRATPADRLTGVRPGVFVAADGQECPAGVPVVRTADPEEAFSRVLALFDDPRDSAPGVHPTAVVDPAAVLGTDVSIAEYCVIRSAATIGRGSVLGPGVFVGRGVLIGRDCVLHPNVCVHDGSVIGDRVTVKSGSVIGGRGYGFRRHGDRYLPIPQIGRVRIGNDVDIGSCVCIDRATIGETVVADGVKIDNLVQIAHNVRIGENALVISQVGLSGSVTVGRGAILAGQVGIADHVSIGENAIVAAKAGVMRDVNPGETVLGAPAKPVMKFKRIEILLDRLADLFRRVDALEKKQPGGTT